MIASAEAQMPMEQEFEDIYKLHHRRVLNLCRYLLNSIEAAEDAAHEVFLRAQTRMSTYDPSLPISSWLSGIASNHCIDLLRRRGTEKRLFDTSEADVSALKVASVGSGPLSGLLSAERSRDVRQALGELTDKYRVPLVLAYYNELNYDEIGSILGVSRAQVATLIFRAKQQLRETFGKEKQRAVSH
jgi:RNA polymerase sigma-70 factor (ECF subfamily)